MVSFMSLTRSCCRRHSSTGSKLSLTVPTHMGGEEFSSFPTSFSSPLPSLCYNAAMAPPNRRHIDAMARSRKDPDVLMDSLFAMPDANAPVSEASARDKGAHRRFCEAGRKETPHGTRCRITTGGGIRRRAIPGWRARCAGVGAAASRPARRTPDNLGVEHAHSGALRERRSVARPVGCR